MRLNMKILGCMLAITSGIIIANCVSNSKYNENQIRENPSGTFWSNGANLRSDGYTFTPPYTTFEIVTIATGVLGVILIATGTYKKQVKET